MAGGGDGFGFGLVTLGTGGGHLARGGTGGLRPACLRPDMITAARYIRAGFPGAVYQIVDVVDGVALFDGDILVAVGDGDGVAGLGGDGVAAVLIVVRPVAHGVSLTGGGVVDCVVGLVDDFVALHLDDLAVVTDNAVVASYGGGAGGDVVGSINFINQRI